MVHLLWLIPESIVGNISILILFLKASDFNHWLAFAHWRSGNNIHDYAVVRSDGFLNDVPEEISQVTEQFTFLNITSTLAQGIKYSLML